MSLIRKTGGLMPSGIFPETSLIKDFFNDWSLIDLKNDSSSEWIPSANVKEDEKSFNVELSIPGYSKKEIHVEVDNNNILRITGERKEESKEEIENYSRMEFRYGNFVRSFQLPDTVNEEKISATCNDGILMVTLPKKETAILKKKVKEIAVA